MTLSKILIYTYSLSTNINLYYWKINIYIGNTALLLAAQKGHLDILKHLITQGSSLQEKTLQGKNIIQSFNTIKVGLYLVMGIRYL